MSNSYFDQILNQNSYVLFREEEIKIENMEVLLKNREKKQIILMSSNCVRIVAAMSNSIPVIPIVSAFGNDISDY